MNLVIQLVGAGTHISDFDEISVFQKFTYEINNACNSITFMQLLNYILLANCVRNFRSLKRDLFAFKIIFTFRKNITEWSQIGIQS